MGTTFAILSCLGKMPSLKDALIRLETISSKRGIPFTALRAAMLVSEVDLFFNLLMMVLTSDPSVSFRYMELHEGFPRCVVKCEVLGPTVDRALSSAAMLQKYVLKVSAIAVGEVISLSWWMSFEMVIFLFVLFIRVLIICHCLRESAEYCLK